MNTRGKRGGNTAERNLTKEIGAKTEHSAHRTGNCQSKKE